MPPPVFLAKAGGLLQGLYRALIRISIILEGFV